MNTLTNWERVDCKTNHANIEEDVVDLGDDGDGYVAYAIFVCLDCGTSSRRPPEQGDYDETW